MMTKEIKEAITFYAKYVELKANGRSEKEMAEYFGLPGVRALRQKYTDSKHTREVYLIELHHHVYEACVNGDYEAVGQLLGVGESHAKRLCEHWNNEKKEDNQYE